MSGTPEHTTGGGEKRPAVVPARPAGEARPAPPFLGLRRDAQAEVGLRQYLRLFSHHFRLMLLVGVLPLIAVATYTYLQPRRYKAQAVVHREAGRDPAAARVQIPLMTIQGATSDVQSGMLFEDIKGRLDLEQELATFAEGRGHSVQAVADDRNQDLIIIVVDTDNVRVAKLANAYAEVLIAKAEDDQRTQNTSLLTAARKSLDGEAEQLSKVTADILAERAKAAHAGIPNEFDELNAQILRLESRKQDAEFQNRELEARIAKLTKSMAEAGVRPPGAAPSDLEKGLIRAELALAQAETKYHESHPSYLKLKSERDEIFKILQRKLEEESREPRLNLDDMQRNLVQLNAEKAGVEVRIKVIGDVIKEKRTRVSQLPPAQGVNPKLDDLLRQQRLLEASVLDLQRNVKNLKVPEEALPKWKLRKPAISPDKRNYFSPRWLTSLALALALAVALALLAAFIAENLEDRIRDQGDLMQNFHLPFLGPVPLRSASEKLLIDLNQPKHLMSSIFEVLRNNINYALPPGVPRVILVASGVVGEGKSTVAANLAISYCLDGNNVLLIDTDLRRPRAHRLFENLCPKALNSPGLAGYLAGRAGLADVELQTGVPNLSFISAGKGAVNPSKLLGSDEMRKLMDHVARHYDVVVLDGPAVLPVVDSTVVSQFASGVVLVVSCKYAPIEQVSTTIARLEHVRARIVGVILNRVEIRSRGYGYFYGSRYGRGYGYGYGYNYGYGYHTGYHDEKS